MPSFNQIGQDSKNQEDFCIMESGQSSHSEDKNLKPHKITVILATLQCICSSSITLKGFCGRIWKQNRKTIFEWKILISSCRYNTEAFWDAVSIIRRVYPFSSDTSIPYWQKTAFELRSNTHSANTAPVFAEWDLEQTPWKHLLVKEGQRFDKLSEELLFTSSQLFYLVFFSQVGEPVLIYRSHQTRRPLQKKHK